MTRFMKELSGELGAYWQTSAQRELRQVEADLAAGKITIDENGVARNCIGRILMSDMLEKVSLVSNRVSVENTEAARDEEVSRSIADYRSRKHQPSAEELYEMRAAFGAGAAVVDVLTGREIRL